MSGRRFLWMGPDRWEALGNLSALLGVVGLLVAGGFGAFEYRDRKQTERAAETLRMIEIWEERGAQKAYFALAQELEQMLIQIPEDQRTDPENAQRLRANLPRRAIRAAPPGAYDEVVYFFTRLSLCIEANLCSAPVAATFFDDSLAGFLDWFSVEIARRREVTPSHAEALEALATLFVQVQE